MAFMAPVLERRHSADTVWGSKHRQTSAASLGREQRNRLPHRESYRRQPTRDLCMLPIISTTSVRSAQQSLSIIALVPTIFYYQPE